MHPGVLASVSPRIQFNWASYAANNPIEDYCFGVHDPNKRAPCCCDVWSKPAGFADSCAACPPWLGCAGVWVGGVFDGHGGRAASRFVVIPARAAVPT